MAIIKRGEKKLFLQDGTESLLNSYIDCRDGSIDMVEFIDCSGYGTNIKAYLCSNSKHETKALIIHYLNDDREETISREDCIGFDSDSWEYIEKLFKGEGTVYRSFMEEQKQ